MEVQKMTGNGKNSTTMTKRIGKTKIMKMTDEELNKHNERKKKIREFIEPHLVYPFNAPSEKWDEADFCLEAIGLKKNALRCVNRKFWKDHDFCLEAVKRRGEAIEWISDKILTTEMCLIAVKHDGNALGSVPKHLLTEALILEALNYDGTALYYVPKFNLTKLIITTAVKQNKDALLYVPEEWREEARAVLGEV